MLELRNSNKIFYGWFIVAACSATLFLSAGLGFYAFSAFFNPLIEEFGWSRAELSGSLSLNFVVMALAGPIFGAWTNRFGARKVMAIGGLVMGGAYALLSLTNSIWYFYATYLVLAAARDGVHIIPVSAVVSNWFKEKRGIAMGIAVTGIGLGGMILVPLVTYLIVALGWRATYAIMGILLSSLTFLLGAFVIRHKPEEMGLLPNDQTAEVKKGSASTAARKISQQEGTWTLNEALRTSAFWLIATAIFLVFLGQCGMLIHAIPFLRDRAVSAQTASTIVGLVAGMGVLGKILAGYLVDRIPVRSVAMLAFVLQAVGSLIILRGDSPFLLLAFVLVFGVSMGSVVVLEPILLAHCFGSTSLGMILGAAVVITSLGPAVGPVFAGYIFDVTGSYYPAFLSFTAFHLIAVALIFFMRPPRLLRHA